MRAESDSVRFRLRSVRGHLDGVIRMVEEDRYCIDVLHQMSAVQGALDRVRRDIFEAHLRGCVPEAISEGRADDIVDELNGCHFRVRTPPTTRPPVSSCRRHPHGDRAGVLR